jgi:hypothetical protein
MLKDKMFKSIRDTTEPTRDGELSTLTNPQRKEHQDGADTTDSISSDHSTSDQDCQ